MNKELKENIMQGTLQAFNQKGLKFTMDDIAKILGISKKTIYQVFRDKEALFLETVDYLFYDSCGTASGCTRYCLFHLKRFVSP